VRKDVVRRDIVRQSVIRSDVRAGRRNGSGRDFALGLDLAQVRDYTAIAIVQRVDPDPATDGAEERASEPSYHVRHLTRFELGTRYPDIVTQVAELMQKKPLRDVMRLVLDRTGVGAPVADMFLHAGLHPIAINITSGQRPSIRGQVRNVPRQYLISTLQIVLQTGRLRIASELEFASVLERELINFSARNSAADDDGSISWRENEHDDLVFALMLAIYYFERIVRRNIPSIRVVMP
jgi:hypothetical protein